MEDIFGNSIGRSPTNNGDQLGKIGPQRIEDRIGKQISDNKEYRLPLYGSGPPLIRPRFIGDTYVDTTNKVLYCAYGLEVADWITPAIVAVTGNLLMESGDYILTEDGYRIILDL